jgi:hypothetical protein
VSKSLRKSLNLDLVDLAEMLRSKGRGRDTVLAHITPKEAALLKARGGRGSTNPHTGLPEYEDDFSFDFSGGGADYTPSYDPTPTYDPAPSSDPTPTNDPAPSSDPVQTYNPAQTYDPSNDAGAASSDTGALDTIGRDSTGGFDMSQYAGQPQPQIDSSVTGEGAFAPGAQDPATTPREDPSTYNPPDNTIKDLFDKYGSNILKLLGPAALAAFGAKTGTTAAQQGQAGADKVAAIGPTVQARAADAQQQMIGPGGLASQAQQFGKQASDQIGAVAPQLQQVGKNIAAYGQPLVDIGSNQMQMALSGGLTPANRQAFEAMKAQSEQGIAKRGGVGVMQAGRAEMDALASLAEKQFAQGQSAYQAGAAYGVQGQSLQAEAARLGLSQAQVELVQNNLSGTIRQNAINLGLQQAGISDQYLIQSIQMGLASDQQTSAILSNLYSKMAQIAFSQPTTTTTTTRPA